MHDLQKPLEAPLAHGPEHERDGSIQGSSLNNTAQSPGLAGLAMSHLPHSSGTTRLPWRSAAWFP